MDLNEKIFCKTLDDDDNGYDHSLYRNKYSFKNYLKYAEEKPDMEKLFGCYFQTGEVCLLAGKTGVGKSILAYQIADGLARGKSILGQPNDTEAQIVLYLDFELLQGSMKMRFKNYHSPDNFLRPDMTQILKDFGVNFDFSAISMLVDETGAAALIVDNISAVSLKTLADADQALKLVKWAKYLQSSREISILLIAHTPKLRETREFNIYDIAGSSQIHNFIDSAIILCQSSKDFSRRYIKSVKNRNCEGYNKVMEIEINSQDWLHFDFVGWVEESELISLIRLNLK